MKNILLVSTRKGLIEFKKNSKGSWKPQKIHFDGEPVSFTHVDTRNNYWYAAIDHGHWGSKLHRSMDEGDSWDEIKAPEYPEGEMINEETPASLKYIWSMANTDYEKGTGIWIGTEPGGLFYSEDKGENLSLNSALWNHPSRKRQWFGGGRDFPGIHSIVVDPENSDHIYIGISCAGVFESVDAGKSWKPRNKGLKADFLPDPKSEIGQDPHLLVAASSDPKIMWQQNHCGIFVSEDGSHSWKDVSELDGPANFGFAISVSETDPGTAWVVPAVSDQTRVAIDHSLCVCRTTDMGKSWQRLDQGLPQGYCFDIVYRHSLDITGETLAFGTTTGNLFLSNDSGDSWETISNFLPMIYAVKFISI